MQQPTSLIAYGRTVPEPGLPGMPSTPDTREVQRRFGTARIKCGPPRRRASRRRSCPTAPGCTRPTSATSSVALATLASPCSLGSRPASVLSLLAEPGRPTTKPQPPGSRPQALPAPLSTLQLAASDPPAAGRSTPLRLPQPGRRPAPHAPASAARAASAESIASRQSSLSRHTIRAFSGISSQPSPAAIEGLDQTATTRPCRSISALVEYQGRSTRTSDLRLQQTSAAAGYTSTTRPRPERSS